MSSFLQTAFCCSRVCLSWRGVVSFEWIGDVAIEVSVGLAYVNGVGRVVRILGQDEWDLVCSEVVDTTM